jgi:hypothetical protein
MKAEDADDIAADRQPQQRKRNGRCCALSRLPRLSLIGRCVRMQHQGQALMRFATALVMPQEMPMASD